MAANRADYDKYLVCLDRILHSLQWLNARKAFKSAEKHITLLVRFHLFAES